MATQTFQHTYFVQAPASKIYAHLAEPASYAGLSPLVSQVSEVQHDVNERNQPVIRYKTVEALHFLGVIPYNNPLNVIMTLTIPNQQLISDVLTGLNVHVRFVFDLQPQDDGTTITETITADTPQILGSYVISQAKSVQQHREKVLKQRMENPTQKGE